jgi:hypothetical protein
VTLSYQLTFDEYREAHTGGLPKKKKPMWRGLVGWTLFACLIAMCWMLTLLTPQNSQPLQPQPEEPSPSAIVRLGAATLPTVAMMCIFGFVIFRQSVKPLPKPWEAPIPGKPKPAGKGQLFGWIAFIVLAAVIFLFLNSRQNVLLSATQPSNTPRVQPSAFSGLTVLDFLPGIIPWCAMFMMLIIVSRMGGDRSLRRTWDAHAFLQRPETVEIDGGGMTFTEPLSRKFYAWSYFPGFKETPNLFLIYVSPLGFFIIPKRAFATPDDLTAFRGHLLNQIQSGQFLEQPAAFPVVPLAVRHEPVDRV